MAKYNITEPKVKDATYRKTIGARTMARLKKQVYEILVAKKMYRDKKYSARQLAVDLKTNSRYISAAVHQRFHMNYTSLVNKYRIEDAKKILATPRYFGMTMEDVSDMVGFSNRQSFYASFYRLTGMTPREYRMIHLAESRNKMVDRHLARQKENVGQSEE